MDKGIIGIEVSKVYDYGAETSVTAILRVHPPQSRPLQLFCVAAAVSLRFTSPLLVFALKRFVFVSFPSHRMVLCNADRYIVYSGTSRVIAVRTIYYC